MVLLRSPVWNPTPVLFIADTTVSGDAVLKAICVVPRPSSETEPAFEIRFQVAPPLVERNIPMPKYESAEELPSPVPTRTTLAAGFELPGWTAMAPVARVGCASVSGVQVTLDALVAAAFVDFHTPPCAPDTNTVLPDASAGSMAIDVTRPVTW